MTVQVISTVGGAAGAPIISERLAAAAGILPGHLVAESSGTVAVQAVAGGAAQKLFAQKNIAIAGDIDTAYASGETVCYGAYHAGQEVSALVAAAAAAIVDGDALEAAGDGTLKVFAAGVILAYATEAVDNSGGASVARINIRVA